MIGAAPICLSCKYFKKQGAGLRCRAFPKEIPDVIIMNGFDHHYPYPGDRGIQYERDFSIEEIKFSG